MTKGVYAYDYGDTAEMAPVAKMDTLGHDFVPPGIHAGGLRYHGMAPLVSSCTSRGIIEPVAVRADPGLRRGDSVRPLRGDRPRTRVGARHPAAVDEANEAKEAGEARVILFNLSGHGHFDMAAYDNYISGNLVDYEYPAAAVARALEELPQVQF